MEQKKRFDKVPIMAELHVYNQITFHHTNRKYMINTQMYFRSGARKVNFTKP